MMGFLFKVVFKVGLLAAAVTGAATYVQYLNGGDPKQMWAGIANNASIEARQTMRKTTRSMKKIVGQSMGSFSSGDAGLSKGYAIPASGKSQMPVSLTPEELKEFFEHAQRPSTER